MTDDAVKLKRIGDLMRKARLEKSLTQAEVAKRAGISENHYAQIERAEKNPSVTTFDNVLNALGVSSKEILGK